MVKNRKQKRLKKTFVADVQLKIDFGF